jgi:hypothetical protein
MSDTRLILLYPISAVRDCNNHSLENGNGWSLWENGKISCDDHSILGMHLDQLQLY